MLNYTCLYVGLWIITTFFYDPTQNSNYSYKFPEGCALKQDHHRHAYQLRYDHRPCDCPCDLDHRKPDTLRL